MRAGMFRRTDPAAHVIGLAPGDRLALQPGAVVGSPWFAVRAQGDGSDELLIYDTIGGWGTSAAMLVDALAERTAGTLNVRINSPGGSVFDGIAIMNALRQHPAQVHVFVDGIAASIASVVALAGDTITMRPGAQFMVHDALAGIDVFGYYNAADLQAVIDEHVKMQGFLAQQSENIAGLYAQRAGGTPVAWRALMLAETWFTADEATEIGLADQVEAAAAREGEPAETTQARAELLSRTWDLSVFRYAGRDSAPAPTLDCASAAADVEHTPPDIDIDKLTAQLKEALA